MGFFPWPKEGERRERDVEGGGHLGCPESLKASPILCAEGGVSEEQSSLGLIASEGQWRDVTGPAPQSR